jgi:hypothetical protein
MGHFIHTAAEFSREALECVAALPPLALLFTLSSVSLLWAAWRQRIFLAQRWKPQYWCVLLHALFFFALITVGVLCEAPLAGSRSSIRAGGLGNLWLNILIYSSFASCAFWVWRMRGLRWFAVSLVTLIEVPILGAAFIAGMSVTGDWL